MPFGRVLLFLCLFAGFLAFAAGQAGFCEGFGSSPQFNNPFAFPRFGDSSAGAGIDRSETIALSSAMFPGLFSGIPHLRTGFAYSFGKNVRYGRGILDYLVPIDIAPATTIFGEVHAEFQDFWKKPADTATLVSSAAQRYDLSVGGGLRRGMTADSILGANAFFDTSRVHDRWYSSGGLGLEFLSRLPGEGLLDLNVNYYGNLFSGTDFVNVFRYGTGNFDIEAGYSQPLFNQALDLRVKAAGYQFDADQKVYGWRTGVDATTRDDMFRLSYEYTRDKISASYHTVAGYVHLGLQLENLFRGQSPLTMPEPIFSSPRNVSRIFHEHVKRRWSQPTQMVRRRGELTIIFMGVTELSSTGNISVTNVNVAAGTFDVEVTGNRFLENILLAYQFRMSDGSTQQVSATVATIDGYVYSNLWWPSLATTVGPATMDNPAGSSTDLTFGQAHRIDQPRSPGLDGTITITISVPGRPDVAPLVITCSVINV